MVSPQHRVDDLAAARMGTPPVSDSVTQATYLKLAQKYLDRKSTTLFIKLTLEATGSGHRCICPLGVRSVWVLSNIRGVPVGVVMCQALCEAISSCAEKRVTALGLSRAEVTQPRLSLCTLPKNDFDRAVRFLELIVDHVCQHAEYDREREELSKSARAVAAHEALETRLRTELNHVLPYVQGNSVQLEKESHPQKIVRRAWGISTKTSIVLSYCRRWRRWWG